MAVSVGVLALTLTAANGEGFSAKASAPGK